MHCNCKRIHVKPSSWYSKDGKTKYIRDQHGITDIVPNPSQVDFSVLKSPESPYENYSDHIHW